MRSKYVSVAERFCMAVWKLWTRHTRTVQASPAETDTQALHEDYVHALSLGALVAAGAGFAFFALLRDSLSQRASDALFVACFLAPALLLGMAVSLLLIDRVPVIYNRRHLRPASIDAASMIVFAAAGLATGVSIIVFA